MKKNACVVIGNFGYRTNHLDGQTIKTRIFYEELKNYYSKVHIIDTSYYTKGRLVFALLIVKYFIKSSEVFIMPAQRGLKLLSLYAFLCKIFKNHIHYVVIGGWLNDYIESNPHVEPLLAKLDSINVETNKLELALIKRGFKNVSLMPNFRSYEKFERPINNCSSNIKPSHKVLRFVYLARVIKEKGIELCIDSIQHVIDEGYNVEFDFYGPLSEKYEKELMIRIAHKDKVKYKGVLNIFEKNFYKNLSKYDIMLFPTFYKGEGFPGTIIDSFYAGVPVIATDWKYNSEFVKDGESGYLIEPTVSSLVSTIKKYCVDHEIIYNQKMNLQIMARKYDSKIIVADFISRIR